jgi:hypothetical protein
MDHLTELWLSKFQCCCIQQLFILLENVAKEKMGLDQLPFSLADLENPPGNMPLPELLEFMEQCLKVIHGDNTDKKRKKLIKFLKKNPPKTSNNNPQITAGKPSSIELKMIHGIFHDGIDLPGSKHNLYGHLQYFSSFFIDMFFGNYTEFMEHVNSLSDEDLKKELEIREGYCQYSRSFAPILGLKMAHLEDNIIFTSREKQEIRTLYNGNNEDKHLEILQKLLELGADPNAHDINGFTPLHNAVREGYIQMIILLLEYGANPNAESRIDCRPLSLVNQFHSEIGLSIVDILVQHGAKLTNKESIQTLRSNIEVYGSKELAVRVREAMPRDINECEKCAEFATKKCAACSMVFYCSSTCQKLDWKFHKVLCKRIKRISYPNVTIYYQTD